MDEGSDYDSMSGGQLRQVLESALAAKAAIESELFGLKAEKVISESGLKLVKPEDLKGVALDDLASKAAEIEQRKATEREAVLKSVLAEKGVAADQVDAALANLLNPAASQASALDRLTQVDRIHGSAPGTSAPQNVFGVSRIRAAFGKES